MTVKIPPYNIQYYISTLYYDRPDVALYVYMEVAEERQQIEFTKREYNSCGRVEALEGVAN